MKTKIKEQVVLYRDKNGRVELRADTEKDTLWGTQDQIAVIFGTTKQNVGKHIKNIYRIGELKENSVVNKSFTTAGYSKHYKDGSTAKDSLIVGKDGKKYLTKLYNLDVILAVGYRVNSKKATKFRIWATGILREYLINGFNLNKNKLVTSDVRLEDLHKAFAFIESKSDKPMKAKISVRLTKDLI